MHSPDYKVAGNDRSVFAKRVKYYIPSLAWIPNYSFSLYVLLFRAPIKAQPTRITESEAISWPA